MNFAIIAQQLVSGMGSSLMIFVLTLLFSMPLGLLVAFGRMSKIKPLQAVIKVFIAILRGTPLMLQLLVVNFAPYYLFRISLPRWYRFAAIIIGFSINYAAYFAEIYRSGIESIPKGQYEAASVLGYNKNQTFFRIIFPQMVKRVLPPVTNEVITLVKDTSGRNGKVLSTFVEMGADSSILYDHAPHIGTDVLRDVVKNIRNRIIAGGGEVHFRTEVTKILEENGRVTGVMTADGAVIETDHVILSVGHSARDLFAELDRMKVLMEPKPFAVGLRIQHPQAQINKNQYGMEDAGKLGAAPYKVTAKTTSGRGVYSFCMCPGGMVVNASSEKGHLAVNGMSNFKRDSGIANSALIVAITPADFPEAGPLGGIAFQRSLEERAFALGGGKIPIQLYGDFAANRPTVALGDVDPVFCGGFSFANLRELMPEALNGAFLEGMEQFGRRIKGFDRADAVLAGIESRTSSPLRICRDESLQSSLKGLYPCGEGAGYAGGITSAAMDGLKVAEEIIKRYAAAE